MRAKYARIIRAGLAEGKARRQWQASQGRSPGWPRLGLDLSKRAIYAGFSDEYNRETDRRTSSFVVEMRRKQTEAVNTLAGLDLIPEQTGDTTEYDQRPTLSRQTTPDTDFVDEYVDFVNTIRTSNTPIKEIPMPALHNRALALKLAVENYTLTPSSDDACETASLIDSDGVIDQDLLSSVLQLAERFVSFLGADEPSTGAVPSGDTDTDTPAAPVRSTAVAIADIRAILETKRADFGSRAVDTALGQLPQLDRIATYEGALNAAVIELAGGDARRELGAAFAQAVTTEIENLQRAQR